LQWTLFYYYCGVQSWGWFYPHHYSPFISDIQHFRGMDFKLSLGKPFLPFQQLLSVLPAASRKSIPTAYHELMTLPTSKIIDFYPTDFQTDLNGKKQEWEAVVLIPFMEEARLLDAMTPCNEKLTAYEKLRNSHGPMYQYDYCPKGRERIEGVANFPALSNVMCSVTEVTRDDVHVALEKIVYGPSNRGPSSVYYPGFPTFKHLQYSARLQAKQVKVFDQPSRSDNMIIKLLEAKDTDRQLKEIGAELFDQTVYTHWPHLAEGKVVEVFNIAQKLTIAGATDTNGREFKLAVGSSREQ
jgi:5'-3' exoribonuclease 1